jgi:hypothetical protein
VAHAECSLLATVCPVNDSHKKSYVFPARGAQDKASLTAQCESLAQKMDEVVTKLSHQ